uniref:EGF-like domain-containing protein n=1 Tax=Romanomermis culicivorax TaxID=13658 RepID=A0A915KJR6_ROMCU
MLSRQCRAVQSVQNSYQQTCQKRCTRMRCSGRGLLVEADKSCICRDGWHGSDCQLIKCLNNGVPNAANRWCHCPMAYTGQFCEKQACQLGSRSNANATGCICPDDIHYSGRHCEFLLCENRGAPVGPECVCTVWHSGAFCQEQSTGYYLSIGVGIFVCIIVAAALLKRIFCGLLCRWGNNRKDRNQGGVDYENLSIEVPNNNSTTMTTNLTTNSCSNKMATVMANNIGEKDRCGGNDDAIDFFDDVDNDNVVKDNAYRKPSVTVYDNGTVKFAATNSNGNLLKNGGDGGGGGANMTVNPPVLKSSIKSVRK